jgi:hypothetical protein
MIDALAFAVLPMQRLYVAHMVFLSCCSKCKDDSVLHIQERGVNQDPKLSRVFYRFFDNPGPTEVSASLEDAKCHSGDLCKRGPAQIFHNQSNR